MPRTLLLALSALLALLGAGCSRAPEPLRAELAVGELLSAPADPRFERALAPRTFAFPADHGPHETFQTEWWYFTGNLADDQGREFAYQVTFFRRALAFEAAPVDSAWSARDVYMAHFTLADESEGSFHAAERFERGALGLAGAQGEPWRVWVRDWSAAGELDDGEVRLRAVAGDTALELTLRRASAVLLNGDAGLSRKGAHPGNASYYYSIPRLETRGELRLGGRTHRVEGDSWFDREWSTSALEPEQVGWDWFALRLEEGSALMLYAMRRADGTRDPASSGTFVDEGGATHPLAAADFEIIERARWTSPQSGARYPSKWTLRVPRFALELEVAPLVPDSELRLAVRYWEGAVRAEGSRGGATARGRGFVELTGY